MRAPEACCKYNFFGHCKFADNCRQAHFKETCTNNTCDTEVCKKRHPRLCKMFSKTGYCRFKDSCSYLHLPGKEDQILEEITKLKVKIKDLQAHNVNLQKRLVSFNQVDKEIRKMK